MGDIMARTAVSERWPGDGEGHLGDDDTQARVR
jgi:hypothetical protein